MGVTLQVASPANGGPVAGAVVHTTGSAWCAPEEANDVTVYSVQGRTIERHPDYFNPMKFASVEETAPRKSDALDESKLVSI